ncbi:MAG: urease accessory protein UreD [Phormidesmis sp.]
MSLVSPPPSFVNAVEGSQLQVKALTEWPLPEEAPKPLTRKHLELEMGHDAHTGKTRLRHCYLRFPLNVSQIFRLEDDGSTASLKRAYLCKMNSASGLLAGDTLESALKLGSNSSLYLADQAATKVYATPRTSDQPDIQAAVKYSIEMGDHATLEYLAAPFILDAEATLTQNVEVMMPADAALSLGEIMVPGQSAKSEMNEFRHFISELELKSPDGKVWFSESTLMPGRNSEKGDISAEKPAVGRLVLVLPKSTATPENLAVLGSQIRHLAKGENPTRANQLDLSLSKLPGDRGLIVRTKSTHPQAIQDCFKRVVNCVRQLRHQAPLPCSV